ncbi:DedA family protein [Natronorarus salvus]|uniref:DedA family protein n=1 Tax=Natronorarus salvus TaxID=3117733 RepID=UPI002F262A8C
MIGWIAELATGFIESYGLLALFVVFVLEGALVGKLIPTRTLLIATVVVLEEPLAYLSVLLVAVVGATIGQCAVFLVVRSRGSMDVLDHRYVSLDDRWLSRSREWFDRWGLPALLVTNTLPVVRGYLVVVVALSRTPAYRFPVFSVAGTLIYVSALVAIGAGVDTVV